jgi:hypothetical protein
LFEQGITVEEASKIKAAAQNLSTKGLKSEAIATGDDKIAFLNHEIHRKTSDGNGIETVSIEFTVKNISNLLVASVLFEAVLYYIDGTVLDTVRHKTIELRPNASRTLCIYYSENDADKINSYSLKVIETTLPMTSTVTGNDKIIILKHHLTITAESYFGQRSCIDFSIRNISEVTIATIIFEAVFYDIEGNILNTVRRTEVELNPNVSRTVLITYPDTKLFGKVKSYKVRIARMVTADAEKVQLRLQEARTTGAGEEEIRGRVKNISTVRTDSALVANFFNRKKEDVGTKVVIIRNIEPGEIRQFRFKFKPQPGDKVDSYTLTFGEIAE